MVRRHANESTAELCIELEPIADAGDAGAAHLLVADGVAVRYGRRLAVTEASLELDRGEVVALIGHNGCGKSTTLRALAGLVPLATGRVATRGAMVALVPAVDAVFADLTVTENLSLGARGETRPDQLARRRADVIDVFPELARRLDDVAGTLSGGEQRMVGTGLALMCRPDVLLLDEPTQTLSPVVARRVLDAVRRLADERGAGVLIAEAHVAAAVRVADRVYTMRAGAIIGEHRGDTVRAIGPTGWWRLL